MSAGYPYRTRRSRPSRPAETAVERDRSNAAIPVAIGLALIALYLARYTVLFPALFAIVLFLAGLSFLSTRLNPLSPHFYLTRKPSWSAIGVVFLAAFLLFYAAYALWVARYGPVIPHL